MVPCLGKRKKKNMSPISSAEIIILGLGLLWGFFFRSWAANFAGTWQAYLLYQQSYLNAAQSKLLECVR